MQHTRAAGQALRLAFEPSRASYVCRACLAYGSRQLCTSSPMSADTGLWKRMSDSVFGSKEKKQADRSREEKTKRRVEEAGKRTPGKLETKTDRYGRSYEIAEVIDPSINDHYMQSSTWDGLESVGSEHWVKNRADHGEQYLGSVRGVAIVLYNIDNIDRFTSKRQSHLSRIKWELLLHHIAVEALALYMAGRDVDQICNARLGGSELQQWQATSKAIIVSANAHATVQFAEDQDRYQILHGIAENEQISIDGNAQAQVVGATDIQLDPSYRKKWMQMSLRNPQLKLAIVKRITQVTGKRIPDLVMSNANTLLDLYNSLQTKEAPKKLARTSEAKDMGQLPNVKVHSRRQTPVHKEREIGRWKLIEDELTLRDLPVFGSRLVNAKEGKILQRVT